jgi:transaldolase
MMCLQTVWKLIEEWSWLWVITGYEAQILAASVRHTMHIVNCAKIGADVMTSTSAIYIETSFDGHWIQRNLADFEKRK